MELRVSSVRGQCDLGAACGGFGFELSPGSCSSMYFLASINHLNPLILAEKLSCYFPEQMLSNISF